MNDAMLMRAVAEAAPVTDDELEGLELEDSLEEELARILASPVAPSAPRPARGRSFGRLRLALAGVVALAVAGALLVTLGSGDGEGDTAFAAEAVHVAEVNPRILIGEPGWRVADVYGFEAERGALTFSKDDLRVGLEWLPASEYPRYERQQRHGDGPPRYSDVLGQRALTSGESGRLTTLIPPDGDVFVILYPLDHIGGEGAWRRILGSLEAVGVRTWLAAMPPEAVLPGEAPANVAEMLRGIPVPPGFDPGRLGERKLSGGPEHVAAVVTQAVSCAWVDAWLAARRSGNQPAADASLRALESYRDWPIRKYWRDSLIPATAELIEADPRPAKVAAYTEQQLNCVAYP